MLENNLLMTKVNDRDDYYLVLEYVNSYDEEEPTIIGVCNTYNSALALAQKEYSDIKNALVAIVGGKWGKYTFPI